MSVKFCIECQTSKSISDFAKAGKFRQKQLYRPICKPCYNAKLRTGYESTRRAFVGNVVEERSPHPYGALPFRWCGGRA